MCAMYEQVQPLAGVLFDALLGHAEFRCTTYSKRVRTLPSWFVKMAAGTGLCRSLEWVLTSTHRTEHREGRWPVKCMQSKVTQCSPDRRAVFRSQFVVRVALHISILTVCSRSGVRSGVSLTSLHSTSCGSQPLAEEESEEESGERR